jgi:hypothetical protein
MTIKYTDVPPFTMMPMVTPKLREKKLRGIKHMDTGFGKWDSELGWNLRLGIWGEEETMKGSEGGREAF